MAICQSRSLRSWIASAPAHPVRTTGHRCRSSEWRHDFSLRRDAQPGMERQDRARDGARDEVNALLDLDIKMLRQKWRSVMGLAVRAKAVGNLGIGLTPDVPLSPIAIVAETVAGTPKPAFRELRGHRMHQQRRIRGLVAGRRCGQTWRTVASPAGLRRALEDDRVV
jgi:hypothetical protein